MFVSDSGNELQIVMLGVKQNPLNRDILTLYFETQIGREKGLWEQLVKWQSTDELEIKRDKPNSCIPIPYYILILSSF